MLVVVWLFDMRDCVYRQHRQYYVGLGVVQPDACGIATEGPQSLKKRRWPEVLSQHNTSFWGITGFGRCRSTWRGLLLENNWEKSSFRYGPNIKGSESRMDSTTRSCRFFVQNEDSLYRSLAMSKEKLPLKFRRHRMALRVSQQKVRVPTPPPSKSIV